MDTGASWVQSRVLHRAGHNWSNLAQHRRLVIGMRSESLERLIRKTPWSFCVNPLGRFFKFFLLYFKFLAALNLRCFAQALSRCRERGLLFCCWARASRGSAISSCGAQAPGMQQVRSVAVTQGLSCSEACVIFLDQGSDPCPLHWQMDSYLLRHQGSPPLNR